MTQLTFDGMTSRTKQPRTYVWKPRPQILEKMKFYFRGYAMSGRQIFAKRKYLAEQFGIKVRTLTRYLAYLGIDFLKTVKRTPRTAYRQVIENRVAGPSAGPSQASYPFTDVKTEETRPEARKPMCVSEERTTDPEKTPERTAELATQSMPVGYDEQFQRYIGIFAAKGKPLNRIDIARAHATWSGMDLADRAAAAKDIVTICQGTKFAKFVPFPVNHLASQGWTRTQITMDVPEELDYRKPGYQTAEEMAEELMSKYGLDKYGKKVA